MIAIESKTCDVVVLGGGLAGMTLALQLKQNMPDLSIAVLEKQSFPLPEAAHKVGESSVEIGAHYYANVLGLKDHIEQQHLPKLGLRFFFETETNADVRDRLELGVSNFYQTRSYQLDRGRFENFLWQELKRRDIDAREGTRVRNIILSDNEEPHCITCAHADGPREFKARWVVDASGRSALLKKRLGLQKSVAHHCNAAWFRVAARIDMDEWHKDGSWPRMSAPGYGRWHSTNHLTGRGYWVWLIPLGSGGTSVGIVADADIHPVEGYNSYEKALAWIEEHEPECGRHLRAVQATKQDFLCFKNYSFSCTQVFSAKRWCLTGEAGLFLDPFYSPGSDFIGISNTFIADLIKRERAAESIAMRGEIYDKLHRSLADNTWLAFEGQYEIFGDPVVMPLKIIWDFATYWTYPAFMFFQDRFCDLAALHQLRPGMERVNHINRAMQRMFKTWYSFGQNSGNAVFVDISAIEFMYELNKQLPVKVPDGELAANFAGRVQRLERLASEISERAAAKTGRPELRCVFDEPPSTCLEQVWPALGL